jgi:hypothetical protein
MSIFEIEIETEIEIEIDKGSSTVHEILIEIDKLIYINVKPRPKPSREPSGYWL